MMRIKIKGWCHISEDVEIVCDTFNYSTDDGGCWYFYKDGKVIHIINKSTVNRMDIEYVTH